jgi:general stress protein 26
MGSVQNLKNDEAVEKLRHLARSADICMFATALGKLPISARPMSVMEVDDDGNLWFFSHKSSEKNKEIKADKKVQLFFASKGKIEYLSVFGEAEIIRDTKKAMELWSPLVKTWFTEGVEDPELTLIKVTPLDAYYWDTKHNKLVAFIKMAAGAISGKTMDDGLEGELTF